MSSCTSIRESYLYTVNPFTGQITTFVTSRCAMKKTGEYLGQASPTSDLDYRDIAMRDDGRLYAMTCGYNGNDTADVNGANCAIRPGRRSADGYPRVCILRRLPRQSHQ